MSEPQTSPTSSAPTRPFRIAINGFGRIGRCVLRIIAQRAAAGELGPVQVVAINDLAPPDTLAHLLRYDTVHRGFAVPVHLDGDTLVVGDQRIALLSERDPAALPWQDLEVDLVLECTGRFVDAESASTHLRAGAGRVLISAPGKSSKGAPIKTMVYGVNHLSFDPAVDLLLSNASCTTNCLAPIAKVLLDTFGIESGLMTTIHSYTNDQQVLDLPHAKGDLRRARAAAQNMIPTSTGAAAAVGEVLPELRGKFDGVAVRVPTMDVSLIDLSVVTERPADAAVLLSAVERASKGEMAGVLAVAEGPLVSSDFIGHSASSIYDAELTRVQGDRLLKVFAWYDNEWGFASRMVDLSVYIAGRS